jgi:acetylornithine deacetylase/succinyl-diaminopimelate desuccinylase-like protein
VTVDPVPILQRLIRFDTTNPPGDEAACIGYLDDLLTRAGIATQVLARDPDRPNLVARLPGRGEAPPLMLYGHVDVVTTAGQAWRHPPFAAEIHGGAHGDVLWGRGALDDKGAVAMMMAALLRARTERRPPGDVLLVVLADEEQGSEAGARFLVRQHPEQFAGVRTALGEGGGYTAWVSGRKVTPIMVAEKQTCAVRVTVRGTGGHGSVPRRGGTMGRLGRVLRALDRRRLPVHVTPTARRMIRALAGALPFPQGLVVRQLLRPALTDRALALMGPARAQLSAALRHTASPTVVRGADTLNVIPAEVTLELDGRLLPGFEPDDLVRELRELLRPQGDAIAVEAIGHVPGPPPADMAGYEALAALLREADPATTPVPYLLSGVTDARFFARLGIQTYGFMPLDLPPGLIETIHAADERVPVAAVTGGADVLYQALQRRWNVRALERRNV